MPDIMVTSDFTIYGFNESKITQSQLEESLLQLVGNKKYDRKIAYNQFGNPLNISFYQLEDEDLFYIDPEKNRSSLNFTDIILKSKTKDPSYTLVSYFFLKDYTLLYLLYTDSEHSDKLKIQKCSFNETENDTVFIEYIKYSDNYHPIFYIKEAGTNKEDYAINYTIYTSVLKKYRRAKDFTRSNYEYLDKLFFERKLLKSTTKLLKKV